MTASHDHAELPDTRLQPARRQSGPETGRSADPANTPRLAGRVSGMGLLALQRSAGNAAVASLVAPVVQRDVEIGEVGIDVSPPTTAPEPAGPAGDSSGAVTSSGGATSINGAVISLNAPMTESSGVIRADTIIANTVVGASYTPGAGNVW